MTLDYASRAVRKISKAKRKVSDFGSEIGDTFDLIELCYKVCLDPKGVIPYQEMLNSIEKLDLLLEDADRIISNS